MDIDRYYNLIKDKYTFPNNLKSQQKDVISRIMSRQNVISDTRTRGHSRKLLKRRCNKDLRHHFFSERVVNRWNKLPSYTVEANSVNQFKSALQKLRTTQIGFFLDVSTSA